MSVSVPTSRFSILGSKKLRSISRRQIGSDSTKSASRPDSELSFRTESQASPRTLSQADADAGERISASKARRRLQPRLDSADGSRRALSQKVWVGDLDHLESDLDTESIRSSTESSQFDAQPTPTTWTDVEDRISSADYEKEAYEPHPAVTAKYSMPEETMKEVSGEAKTFQGLSNYTLDLGKSRKLIDDDYLKDAFGITMSRRASEDVLRREKIFADEESIPPLPSSEEIASPRSEKSDMFEMEVPLTLDIEMPPMPRELAANSPSPRGHTLIAEKQAASDSDEPTSTDSSTSTLKQARLAQQLRGDSATAVATVSPTQVLESPKPRRPFSTVSIEGMTNSQLKKTPPELAIKSANSMSSDDTSGQDGKSSEHSPRSSMSSVASAHGGTKSYEPRAESRQRDASLRVVDATALRYDTSSMYNQEPVPRESPSATSRRGSDEQARVRRQASEGSIKSNTTVANVNKPLPPEPGRSKRLSHISEQSSTPSRASSITIRQSNYATRSRTADEVSGNAPWKSPNSSRVDSRMSTLSGWSLRSKYTPKDLDALDDAFERGDPPRKHEQTLMNSYHQSPSQSSTSLVPNARSGPEREDNRQHSRHGSRKGSISNEPPQPNHGTIRADGRMGSVPSATTTASRKNSLVSLMVDKSVPRLKAKGRSQTSNHVGAQARELQEPPVQRSATIVMGGSSSKAHRILGKAPSIKEESFDRNWPRQDSPEPLEGTPVSSRSGADTPEYERSQDAHFEEIRKRMELLSPKDDPNSTFMSIHERHGGPRPSPVHETPPRRARQPTLPTHDERLEHVAELEAATVGDRQVHKTRAARPVELEGCQPNIVAELPLPSPPAAANIERMKFVPPPPPPPPMSGSPPAFERDGRNDTLKVPSIKERSNPSQRSTKARSIASLVASEIPEIYAGLPSHTSSLRPSMSDEDHEQMISADAAERVLYRILQSLNSLGDLFAAARVSRGFYRTFKQHELHLLRRMLWRMSPASWELREMSTPSYQLPEQGTNHTRNLYFADYTRDMWTLVKLKALILEHCKSFLRAETIRDLGGESESSSRIDEAFWRVWTFCKIFGGGSDREHDILGQMDWLKGGRLAKQSAETKTMVLMDEMARNSVLYDPPVGFAEGNGNGLSADELYDMTEIWTCLGVLVRGYHEKRDLARKYGVFDSARVPKGDVQMENAVLEEWTYYLLTQGPPVILQAKCPTSPGQETFSRARSQGHTSWTPPPDGLTRSTFLKEALSRVYDEQMHKARPLMAGSPKGFSDLPQVVSLEDVGAGSPNPFDSRQRLAAHQAELRVKKEDPSYRDVPVSDERPMSNFQNVLARLEAINTSSSSNAPAVPKIPNIASRFTRRKPKITEPLEEKAKLVEELVSPSSLVDSGASSPIDRKPGKSNRLGTIRSKVTGKSQKPALKGPGSKQSLGSDKTKASQTSLHSYNSMHSIDDASISTRSDTMGSRESTDRQHDVFAPMVAKLVALGFEEGKSRRALDKNTRGNFIDFEKALATLAKQRELKKKMERLDRMG